MKIFFMILSLFPVMEIFSQSDTANKRLRAFPITGYMVDMTDSSQILQIEMPENLTLKDRQLGVLYGVYQTSKADAVQKGYGRCHLIKGVYHYFTISFSDKSLRPLKGDLIYTFVEKPTVFEGKAIQLASHFIQLQNVYEVPLYDRYKIYQQWTEADESRLMDSIVSDVRFTGDYYKRNNPEMDIAITSGSYTGKKTFYVMAECKVSDIQRFLSYMIARPRLYAGREWKISELFATWLSEGAPQVKEQ